MNRDGFPVRLRFHGDLGYFLKAEAPTAEVTRSLNEPTSVKDAIESCGVPHPEVNWIRANDSAVRFDFVLKGKTTVDIYPFDFPSQRDLGQPLQRKQVDRFVADGHLGKLVRALRLLGFDVAYHNEWNDRQLLEVMQRDDRAILTRDRRLLMHGVVRDGYCPRSDNALEQTVEVIRRFGLQTEFRPFTRCIHCNGILQPVDKAAVLERLEPLTKLYYSEFRSCVDCGKIFWRGSHFGRLTKLVERLRAEVSP